MWIKTAAFVLLSVVCLSSAYRTEEDAKNTEKLLQFIGTKLLKSVIVQSLRIARFRNDGGELHSGDQELHSNRIQVGVAAAARQDDTNQCGDCQS